MCLTSRIFTESLTDKVKKLLKQLLYNEGWDGALENELEGRARSVLKELVLARDEGLPRLPRLSLMNDN